MSNLKILVFLAFTFIASGIIIIMIVSGDSFSEELVVVSAEGGFYRLTIENTTLIGETELIPPISTFATRPYCSTCGATYNGLLFDNWYFLPGLNGMILGLKSTQFNNLIFTSWKLGDCEPLALGVHSASKFLYISCATNDNTVSLRVIDFVHGGEPGNITFKINSSVSNEYTESRSQNPGIFVEYNRSYHFVSSVGNDLLIHKLDGFLVKHLGTYRAPCFYFISDIAVLKDTDSLVTRCGRYTQIYIFNLYSAVYDSVFFAPHDGFPTYSEPDYNFLVSYSGSYVALWSSKEINVFTTSSWQSGYSFISNSSRNITSLTFVESEGRVLIVYTDADVGVYTWYSLIPGSHSVCSVDGCLGITSVGSLAVAAKISGGLLFYSFSSTSVTTYGPYACDYNITRVVPNLLSLKHNVTGTHSILNIPGLVPGVIFCQMAIMSIVLCLMLINSRIPRERNFIKNVYFGTERLLYDVMNVGLFQCVDRRVYPVSCLPHSGEDLCLPHSEEDTFHPDLCLPHSEEDTFHPDLCLPHSEEVDDVLEQVGCFVLGDIQTITITETGGKWNLYPFPNDERETCAMLSAPPGVVANGKTVVLTYGVIPSGPFVFPDGLELASVLIYLDCNDKEKLQKPLSLRLKHCITGDDEVLQNSLCFVKAAHRPQDGSFVFQSKSNAVFDSKSGTLEFTDFCVKGICVKKACEEIEEISTRCYAIPCRIQLHPTSRVSYEYRICLVFGLPSWENVFREHYCTRSEYNREILGPQVVEFKANEPIQSYVEKSKGNGWEIKKRCDSVAFVELKFALEHFCKMKSEQILGELASGFIFPHVKYDINHKREPNTSTHVNHVVYLTMQGCTKDTDFPIYVREELKRERSPEGAEDGEGPSRAVQQQSPESPIGGFVQQGTSGKGFLDWTPSDAGLLKVVKKSPSKCWEIAVSLGVPFETVNALTSEKDPGNMKDGMKVLIQWRDGMEGCRTPSTWNTLLKAVKYVLGANVYDELEKEVMENEFLSIRKETRH